MTTRKAFGIHEGVEAFPLHWPQGWMRTPAGQRQRAKFHRQATKNSPSGSSYTTKESMTVASARKRLLSELGAFTRVGQPWRVDPNQVVISSNLPVRLDGLPYSNVKEPADPGVAVYFLLDQVPHCLPCDRWATVADNIAAIAAHLGALRGMERWGVGDVRAAFAGFRALPPAGANVQPTFTVEQAAQWLAEQSGLQCSAVDLIGVPANIQLAYRAAAKRLHPDAGGSAEAFSLLQDVKRVLEQK